MDSKTRMMVAKELVFVAKELQALDMGMANPDAVETLVGKLVSRLGQAKMRKLREYGIDVKPTDTVEQLARAWATVLVTG